jgi:cell division protein FtsB
MEGVMYVIDQLGQTIAQARVELQTARQRISELEQENAVLREAAPDTPEPEAARGLPRSSLSPYSSALCSPSL